MTAYNALKNRLDNSKIKFYTYTPKHLKLKNTVLKGVIGDFTIKDIKLDIEAMNLPNVKIEKITKVNFGKSKFPNFIVQLSHDSELSSLTKIKTILHQVVRWEPLRKSQTYQCRNCQRINHTSSNCFLGYRCVKCDQPNEPGQCALSQDCTDKSKIYCVKCEELGHPALYRSCPYLKLASKVLKNISERRATKLTKIKETLLVNSSNNQNFIGKTAYERPRMNTVNKPRDDIPSTNRWIPRSNEILFGDNNIPPEHSNKINIIFDCLNINYSLKIAAINVNSIVSLNKRNELLNFAETHNFDIVLIGETKLSERHRIHFTNHDFICTVRKSNKGGGTAILIKSSLPYKTVHHPSCSDNVAIVEELKLFHPCNYFLISGDFNAKHTIWGNTYTRVKGWILSNSIDAKCITSRVKLYMPFSPTFPCTNLAINLYLADCRLNFTDLIDNKIKTLNYNSDHVALSFTISIICELNLIDPSISHHFAFKKTKWHT
uniref:Endonuclease/exonuclease/phosphatase domain-containing protein n=1 Tax=Trichogramma kaykai TaxID=54128 RepID=A0ABD2XJ05_9HYME